MSKRIIIHRIFAVFLLAFIVYHFEEIPDVQHVNYRCLTWGRPDSYRHFINDNGLVYSRTFCTLLSLELQTLLISTERSVSVSQFYPWADSRYSSSAHYYSTIQLLPKPRRLKAEAQPGESLGQQHRWPLWDNVMPIKFTCWSIAG